MAKLTEDDIKLQRKYNQEDLQASLDSHIVLPLDDPYELWDILDKVQKALITDNLTLCADCLERSFDTRYGNEAPIKVTDSVIREYCMGYECKNEAKFRAYFSNKL